MSSKRRPLDPSIVVIDAQVLIEEVRASPVPPPVRRRHRPDCVVVINDAYVIAKALMSGPAQYHHPVAYLQVVYECLLPVHREQPESMLGGRRVSDRWSAHLTQQGGTVPVFTVGGVDPAAILSHRIWRDA
jgi:hypothetical protein